MSRMSDEFMKKRLQTLRRYTMVALHRTKKSNKPGAGLLTYDIHTIEGFHGDSPK